MTRGQIGDYLSEVSWHRLTTTPFDPNPPVFEATLDVGRALAMHALVQAVEYICSEHGDEEIWPETAIASIDGQRLVRVGVGTGAHTLWMYDATGESRFITTASSPHQLRMIARRDSCVRNHDDETSSEIAALDRFHTQLQEHILTLTRFELHPD